MPHIARRHAGASLAMLTGLLLAAAKPAAADNLRDLLEEALDQPIASLRVEVQPLHDALEQIEQVTGVRFVLADEALDYMPYGARTRVSVVVSDLALRPALERLLDGLGLAMRVQEDHVFVYPGPVLERVGRRLTVAEVGLLSRLAAARWSELDRDDLAMQYTLDPNTAPAERLAQALAQVHNVNATRELEAATRALGWVWVPDGGAVTLRSQVEDVRLRLEHVVAVDYQRAPLEEVLVDLGQRVGVTVSFEPGVLARVAARERAVDLSHPGTSVRQALERLCGSTGLRYEVRPEGVHISGPPQAEAARPIAGGGRLVRVNIALEQSGISVDYIIREDELPPAVRAQCEERLQRVMEELGRGAANKGRQ
jgi:hypothetical protein